MSGQLERAQAIRDAIHKQRAASAAVTGAEVDAIGDAASKATSVLTLRATVAQLATAMASRLTDTSAAVDG
jgi:hypothetical protein